MQGRIADMRDIAEFVRHGDDRTQVLGNAMLIQMLAAQVVARAAYDGVRFANLNAIRHAVFEVAGYVMPNRVSGPPGRLSSTVDEEAAYRVAELVRLKVEYPPMDGSGQLN
jgi:hypothetical protein